MAALCAALGLLPLLIPLLALADVPPAVDGLGLEVEVRPGDVLRVLGSDWIFFTDGRLTSRCCEEAGAGLCCDLAVAAVVAAVGAAVEDTGVTTGLYFLVYAADICDAFNAELDTFGEWWLPTFRVLLVDATVILGFGFGFGGGGGMFGSLVIVGFWGLRGFVFFVCFVNTAGVGVLGEVVVLTRLLFGDFFSRFEATRGLLFAVSKRLLKFELAKLVALFSRECLFNTSSWSIISEKSLKRSAAAAALLLLFASSLLDNVRCAFSSSFHILLAAVLEIKDGEL